MDLSLHDEHEIHAVLVRYAAGIDQRDWAQFASCFTDDFTGDYGSFGSWTSARAITQFMRETHATVGATLHRLSNITISSVESRVVSRTYVDAVLMPGVAGGAAHQGIGYYDDEWRKTAAGWQIGRRRFTLVSFS